MMEWKCMEDNVEIKVWKRDKSEKSSSRERRWDVGDSELTFYYLLSDASGSCVCVNIQVFKPRKITLILQQSSIREEKESHVAAPALLSWTWSSVRGSLQGAASGWRPNWTFHLVSQPLLWYNRRVHGYIEGGLGRRQSETLLWQHARYFNIQM